MNTSRSQIVVICSALMALAAIPYVQTLQHDFINYDDWSYVSENQIVLNGVTWEGVKWLTTAVQVGHWVPLTGLSHMLDCDLYRQPDGTQWPGGHHLTSTVLHVVNTLLLFWALSMLFGSIAIWRCALVTALFAVHPTHVESVAWVSERKDVLSTLFGFAAIGLYVWYTQRASLARYSLVFICTALSLLAKPMFVTMPCVLLLLDIWPLKRWRLWTIGEHGSDQFSSETPVEQSRLWRLLLDKVPLFGLSIGASIMAVLTQAGAGATSFGEQLSVLDRFANAAVAYCAYVYTLMWPANLALIYPHPSQWPAQKALASVVVLAAISSCAWISRRTQPHLLIGWLFFLGTLIPVIGLIPTSAQYMADRYLYVPATGIFLAVAWAIPVVQARAIRSVVIVACLAVTAVLTILAINQTSYWYNSRTLFSHVLAVTQDNVMAEMLMAKALFDEGEIEGSIDHLRKAVRLQPNLIEAKESLANALIEVNRLDEAAEQLEASMAVRPTAYAAHHLGRIHVARQEWAKAAEAFQVNIELDPENRSQGLEHLASVYIQLGRYQDAIDPLRAAIEHDTQSSEAFNSMGVVMLATGQPHEAIHWLEQAVQIDADNIEAHGNLGSALFQLGQAERALAHLQVVARHKPERIIVRTNLAAALIQVGRTEDARRELQSILERNPNHAPAHALLQSLDDHAKQQPIP